MLDSESHLTTFLASPLDLVDDIDQPSMMAQTAVHSQIRLDVCSSLILLMTS